MINTSISQLYAQRDKDLASLSVLETLYMDNVAVQHSQLKQKTVYNVATQDINDISGSVGAVAEQQIHERNRQIEKLIKEREAFAIEMLKRRLDVEQVHLDRLRKAYRNVTTDYWKKNYIAEEAASSSSPSFNFQHPEGCPVEGSLPDCRREEEHGMTEEVDDTTMSDDTLPDHGDGSFDKNDVGDRYNDTDFGSRYNMATPQAQDLSHNTRETPRERGRYKLDLGDEDVDEDDEEFYEAMENAMKQKEEHQQRQQQQQNLNTRDIEFDGEGDDFVEQAELFMSQHEDKLIKAQEREHDKDLMSQGCLSF